VLLWEEGKGQLHELADEGIASIQGADAWRRRGVAVSLMSDLPVTIYTGEIFDNGTGVIWSYQDDNLPAIYAFCASPEFNALVRKIDHSIKVTNQTLLKVPFDLSRWRSVAPQANSADLPRPFSTDSTQWLFEGSPKASDQPLQVAVARLLGYRWPSQTGSSFWDCPALTPDGLEKHADTDGIVPLSAIAGEASAAHRLRELLADAYGSEWSAAKLQQLLGDCDSLEQWLRDSLFEEHCRVYHQRPFVWDGRADGFHALVNYHRLAAPNGEGRKTLERLIYTYLGRWIERQTDEVTVGKEGADARLTAAVHLKNELQKILKGEKPYDIFVRWKPLHEQPVGWEPDISDGVRMNIRPWLASKVHQPSRRDGCILRVTPRIPYGKDRGTEPRRTKDGFPWFWSWDERTEDFVGGDNFDGARWNDLHYSLDKKKRARVLKQAAEATK
jgi:hypothetical protein